MARRRQRRVANGLWAKVHCCLDRHLSISVGIQAPLPRPIGVFPPFLLTGARGRAAEMLSTNLLWQVSPVNGAAPTQTVTPVGLVTLANAAVTPRCVGIHRCIPPLSFRGAPPALPVHPQGSAHLQDALRCQPELCREDAPRGFAPSCSGASPSPRMCP